MTLRLLIGNKNYSSWSMRPWLAMRAAGIEFQEVPVRFDGFGPTSTFKRTLAAVSPTGTVPVLLDGDLAVWDTLAIAEYLAERFPDRGLWPTDPRRRARARSVCAEMHAGFSALRRHLPQNIEARLPHVGARILASEPGVAADVRRIEALWADALQSGGGPFLFGGFGIADAYFAPVAWRFITYGVPVTPASQAWIDALRALPAMQQWEREALAERDFLDFEEPYRNAEQAGHPPRPR